MSAFAAPSRINLIYQPNLTGVGRHASAFDAALRRLAGAETEIVSIDPADTGAVVALMDAERAPADQITLFFTLKFAHLLGEFVGRKLAWAVFESDRLAPPWVKSLAGFDAVWTPSDWGRGVLLAHGLPPARVVTVPEGVEPLDYYPAPLAHDGFVFLSVGKVERRKSLDELIAAFSLAFPAHLHPRVRLRLKADYPRFPERVLALRERVAGDARIEVLAGEFSDAQMAQLYRSADAFVFPSKAEGFGLPALEALACGLPLAAVDCSGQSQYLARIGGLFRPIGYRRGPIDDPDYAHYYRADYGIEPFGDWALPDLADLVRALRDLRDAHALWQARALAASRRLREEFGWDACARLAWRQLRTL
ncbi:glycosyltransferase [Derxia lacustris]|uniref:glycosyltransferase n=1 Tax=Derxia lacustris TaxID=764842 RepID=UPI000A17539D|nr:glycosyltransferase [Derxia lacustris]